MNIFWILSSLMMTMALLFILPTLFSNRPRGMGDKRDLNSEVIKQQLTELAADLENGKLDSESYHAARTDLERELLAAQQTETGSQRTRGGQWAALLLAFLVPAVALMLYRGLGNPTLSSDAVVNQQTGASGETQSQQGHPIAEMVEKLAKRLQEKPDDVEGWTMLGRSYALMNRFSDAQAAYAKAVALNGEDGDLLADYADVMITANGGQFTDEAGELLRKAMSLEPENVKALWLMGHWQFQHGNYQDALDLWQKTAARIAPTGSDADAVNQQIRMAQEKLGIPPTAPASTASVPPENTAAAGPAAGNASIKVDVELDPSLKSKVQPNDTLFIYARAQQGPRMPLAIVRDQASALPVSVTLDDSQSMSPMMKLSSVDEVVVGARISKTGQAMPASGDLQGTVEHVKTHDGQQLKIVINETVP